MTRVTTAVLFVSPAAIGPWGDEAWRIGNLAQLVEGGGGGPYWIVGLPSVQPEVQPDITVTIDGLDSESITASVEKVLMTSRKLSSAEHDYDFQLAVVILDPESIFEETVIHQLRKLGYKITRFVQELI